MDGSHSSSGSAQVSEIRRSRALSESLYRRRRAIGRALVPQETGDRVVRPIEIVEAGLRIEDGDQVAASE